MLLAGISLDFSNPTARFDKKSIHLKSFYLFILFILTRPTFSDKVRRMTKDKSFSATEVGTLVEGFRTDLSLVSERVGTLCEDMSEVKDRISSLEGEVRGLKDAVRLSLPRISRLESKAGL